MGFTLSFLIQDIFWVLTLKKWRNNLLLDVRIVVSWSSSTPPLKKHFIILSIKIGRFLPFSAWRWITALIIGLWVLYSLPYLPQVDRILLRFVSSKPLSQSVLHTSILRTWRGRYDYEVFLNFGFSTYSLSRVRGWWNICKLSFLAIELGMLLLWCVVKSCNRKWLESLCKRGVTTMVVFGGLRGWRWVASLFIFIPLTLPFNSEVSSKLLDAEH